MTKITTTNQEFNIEFKRLVVDQNKKQTSAPILYIYIHKHI